MSNKEIPTINAANFETVAEVRKLLNIDKEVDFDLRNELPIESIVLSDTQASKFNEISNTIDVYRDFGGMKEKTLLLLNTSLLLDLSELSKAPGNMIDTEEAIEIEIEDDSGKIIKGKLDLIVTRNIEKMQNFCVLVVESKRTSLSLDPGIPQLISYMYAKLGDQKQIWGWATNGLTNQFMYLKRSSEDDRIFYSRNNQLIIYDDPILLKALISIEKHTPS